MSDLLALLPADASPEGSERVASAPVSTLFPSRWSRRAFADRPVPEETVRTLFEAARWAPSCFNEQPWRFVVASPASHARFVGLLNEANQVWASRAPVLAFVLTRRAFTRNDKPNRFAAFDAGAAWMSLALQAHALGLSAHAMAGIREEAVIEELEIDTEQWELLCAIAVGWPGDPATLPEGKREAEKPNGRKGLGEVFEVR